MMSKVVFAKTLWFSTFLVTFTAGVIYGQTYRGAIKGEVRDSAGQLLAGASVTAKNSATGQGRETTTTSDGTFIIPELAPGEYEVTASSKGFASVTKNALVDVGSETNVDLSFAKLTEATEKVTVTAETPLIDTGRDVLGQVVDNRLVTELPLNGRDFGKLVALTPGVTVEGSGVAGTEKGFGQFNINGNRDRSKELHP